MINRNVLNAVRINLFGFAVLPKRFPRFSFPFYCVLLLVVWSTKWSINVGSASYLCHRLNESVSKLKIDSVFFVWFLYSRTVHVCRDTIKN